MPGGHVAGRFAGFPREAIGFFKSLEANNNRDWFQAHKETYDRACREPMQALMAELQPKFGASKISRINRDIRFTPDRSPYKTHIAAGIGGYYIMVSAEGLYVGTGIYKPDPAVLARFRVAIDRNASGRELGTIVNALTRKGYDVDTHTVADVGAEGLCGRSSSHRSPAHEGHLRGPRVQARTLACHEEGARSYPARHARHSAADEVGVPSRPRRRARASGGGAPRAVKNDEG